METKMQAVTFYSCRQGRTGKKFHRKLFDVHNKDSCSLGGVKYWGRQFKGQRSNPHNEVRLGRPLVGVSAHIALLLNDESFSSTRHLARRLTVTKEIVKRNLQEVLGFHRSSLKWVPNLLSAEQKSARVEMSRELYNNLIFERQKNFAMVITGDENWYHWSYTESSMWARSRDDVSTRPLQKNGSAKPMFTMFSAARNLRSLIVY
jgi:hypothetical protein